MTTCGKGGLCRLATAVVLLVLGLALGATAGTGSAAGEPMQAQASPGVEVAPSAGTSGGLDIASLRTLPKDDRTVRWKELTIAEIQEMVIVDRQGSVIGDVERVLADPEGKIVAVTAQVGGIIFGIGSWEVVVPLEQLDYDQKRFATNLSSEQLKALPRWE